MKGIKRIAALLVVFALCLSCASVARAQGIDMSGFSSENAQKAMKTKEFKANGKLIAQVKSKYPYPTQINAKCTYYKGKTPVDYSTAKIDMIEKGHTGFLMFRISNKDYTSYEVQYNYHKPSMLYTYNAESIVDKIKLKSNFVDPYIMITLKNGSDVKCENCRVAIIYYSKSNKIIDVQYVSAEIKRHGKKTKKVYIPYVRGSYEDKIEYDHYKAFVSTAAEYGIKTLDIQFP